ncbi:aminotransferase class IV [Rhizosaccharibacter radicis]|uniref:Probable branched-chain-amino-acid aminotransferase n=1 Tax=Rhizosaccharibacter radicis TaxID=2782605 RepID=A0ABT1VZ82_9PROT|nr:aminotransferase class IV [Acetobacteraceae bacterium KSS12]
MTNTTVFWLDGRLVEAGPPLIRADDRAFLLGDGLFETIRVADGTPRHVDRHLQRLTEGAAFLDIPLPYTREVLTIAIERLIRATGTMDGTVRLTLSRGSGERGIGLPERPCPLLLMTIVPMKVDGHAPIALATARETRRNEHSPLGRLKSLNYLDSILARREASRRGADDALLLSTAGQVAEASVANVIVSFGGKLWTPPVSDGALPGIMRGILMETIGIMERSFRRDDLDAAEALFLCNSLAIRQVGSLDGRHLSQDPVRLGELREAGGFGQPVEG